MRLAQIQLKANLGYTFTPVSKKKKGGRKGKERKNESSCFVGAMRTQRFPTSVLPSKNLSRLRIIPSWSQHSVSFGQIDSGTEEKIPV